jgi:hypothetical protein
MEQFNLKGERTPKTLDVRVVRPVRLVRKDESGVITPDIAAPNEVRKLETGLALELLAAKKAARIGSEEEREFLASMPAKKSA